MARTSHTDVSSLWLLHWLKAEGGPVPGPDLRARLCEAGLYLDTCLRTLVLGLAPRPAGQLTGSELLVGTRAYRFALEVTSGLLSAVPGETNVFGQFRRAWRESPGQRNFSQLARLIDHLVEDTRDIRRTHLEGIGGNSYGSLVRRLLVPLPGARILIVGSGDLARSLLPFLGSFAVGLWSRRPATPAARNLAGVERWFGPDEAALAGHWADHVVLTTPADDGHDQAWISRLAAGRARSVIHLGRRRNQPLPWHPGLQALDLDDVFDLAAEQASFRSRQLAKARLACARRADERGGSRAPGRPGLFAPVLQLPA